MLRLFFFSILQRKVLQAMFPENVDHSYTVSLPVYLSCMSPTQEGKASRGVTNIITPDMAATCITSNRN